VAQLNLYVPDELAARLKAEARQAKLPLSSYIVGQLTKQFADDWPEGYFENVLGFWKGEDIVIEDLPPEPLSEMDSFG
jgi:hypothetical protein